MYHTGPLSGVRLLAAGVPVVVLGRFDAENVLRAIETHRVETTVMVPTHFVRLLALPRGRAGPLRRQLAAARRPHRRLVPDRRQAQDDRVVRSRAAGLLRRHRGRHDVHDLERGVAGSTPDRSGVPCRRSAPSSSTSDDDEVPAGTEGRLYFEDATGRGIVYPGDPEKTAAAHLRPGVFTLGEIGYVTEDGFVYITDRFSDMIVSGGVNIYPAEAEQVLIEHPQVADVAVIGVPNREMGEEVKALVVPADPADPPDGRGADRLVPRAARRLQVPALGRHRRDRRPHRDGQGQQARAAQAVLGRRVTTSVSTMDRLVSLAAGTVLDLDPAGTVDAAAAAGFGGAGLWFDPATWTLGDDRRRRAAAAAPPGSRRSTSSR